MKDERGSFPGSRDVWGPAISPEIFLYQNWSSELGCIRQSSVIMRMRWFCKTNLTIPISLNHLNDWAREWIPGHRCGSQVSMGLTLFSSLLTSLYTDLQSRDTSWRRALYQSDRLTLNACLRPPLSAMFSPCVCRPFSWQFIKQPPKLHVRSVIHQCTIDVTLRVIYFCTA